MKYYTLFSPFGWAFTTATFATGVATETDVDFIDSSGAARTVNFEAAGESVSCIYNDTTSAWQTIAYGTTAAANNIVGSQDVT